GLLRSWRAAKRRAAVLSVVAAAPESNREERGHIVRADGHARRRLYALSRDPMICRMSEFLRWFGVLDGPGSREEVDMRRVTMIAACCVLVQLLTPTPAHAWWDWLDQLSGPGPFMGWDVRYRLACIQDPSVDAAHANDKKLPDNGLRSLDSFRTKDNKVGAAEIIAGVAGVGCLLQPGKNPIGSLNITVGRFYSINNRLQYQGLTEGPTVKAWEVEPSFSMFVDRLKVVQLSTGLGWLVFSGDGFESFNRFYFKPVTVTITPGAQLQASGGLGRLARTATM